MTDANNAITGGDQPGGDRLGKCALAILPDTPNAKISACAPMLVMWTRDILYPLGRMQDGLVSIGQALACDPDNPDAQLIQQQLQEILKQQEGQPPPDSVSATDAPSAGGGG